jgi:hypothetical protein
MRVQALGPQRSAEGFDLCVVRRSLGPALNTK